MTRINRSNEVDPSQYSKVTGKPRTLSPGSELGSDFVHLTKEFSKGKSSGSANMAASVTDAKKKQEMDNKAKANAAEQTRSVDDSKRVTVAKTVAASQAHSGIKSQTDKQNTRQSKTNHININEIDSKKLKPPQLLPTCIFCKGTGCSSCSPTLTEMRTQDKKVEIIHKLDDHRKRLTGLARIKANIDRLLKVFKPDKIKPDQQIDKTNRHKKRNLNTYAEWNSHDDP